VRVFIALTPAPEVQRAVWEAFAPLRARADAVKWVRPDALHLTLKFLGDVADDRAAELATALGEAVRGARPIPLAVRGAGAFPDPERPRVFWAGVEPEPALELLQDRVERVFAPLGFPTEARAFRPHLTLGRAGRRARPRDFAGVGRTLAELRVEATDLVEGVDLIESVLGELGPVYHRVHHERLS
jgi:2'-5' RNA ligase